MTALQWPAAAVLVATLALTAACGGTDPARASATPARTPTAAPTASPSPTPGKPLPTPAPTPEARAVAPPTPVAADASSVTPTARTTDIAAAAFDAWRDARVRRAAQNLRALLTGRATIGAAIVDAAEVPGDFARAASCAADPPRLDVASLDPLPELLAWLGFAVGDLRTGAEPSLRRWLWTEYYLPALNPIRQAFALPPLAADDLDRGVEPASGVPPGSRASFAARVDAIAPKLTAPAMFARALRLQDGDVYRALLTAHNVLRAARADPGVQAVLAPMRTDGGDNSGAYYHLFGLAAYAVAYELATAEPGQAASALAGPNPLPPEAAAALEEVLVSDRQGDVAADPTELAVDLLGARVGRHLYAALAPGGATLGVEGCATPAATAPA